MQALDVYVFGRLKARLRELHSDERRRADDGRLSAGAWIRVTARAVDEVLVRRDWADTFAKLGLGAAGVQLNSRFAAYAAALTNLDPGPLSDAAMDDIMGRRRVNLGPRFFNGPQNVLQAREAAAREAAAGAPAAPLEPPRIPRGRRLGPALPRAGS